MRRSVYIDTTIPSYYVDQREALRLHIDRTRLWWDIERFDYEVYCSGFVELELSEASFIRDAIHLAYASHYKMDYLLTWNIKHLANARKREHIRVINSRLRLSVPEIITPLELLREEQ